MPPSLPSFLACFKTNSFGLKFKVAHLTNVGLGSATRHVLNQSMYLVSLLNERHVSLTDLGRTIFLLAFPASSGKIYMYYQLY